MRFARRIFLAAGVYGLLSVPPLYFLEERSNRDRPPAITHPEYYYGFIGVALAWQIAFVIISRDPARYRPLMLAGVAEKFSWAIAVLVLWMGARVDSELLVFGGIDFVLGVLFLAAYWKVGGDTSTFPHT